MIKQNMAILAASAFALSAIPVAFANKPNTKPTEPTTEPTAPIPPTTEPTAPIADAAKAKSKRVDPELTEVEAGIAIPTAAAKVSNRGSKSSYPFETLEVGSSFGVKNKTQKQLSSIVSNQNRKKENQQQKRDASGALMFGPMINVTDANGAVVGQKQGEPLTENIKTFFAADVDPKTDPKGASVRVWRTK